MAEYVLLYEVIEYLCKEKSPKEIATKAYNYRIEMAVSIALKKEQFSIKQLVEKLDKLGTDKAKDFSNRIHQELVKNGVY